MIDNLPREKHHIIDIVTLTTMVWQGLWFTMLRSVLAASTQRSAVVCDGYDSLRRPFLLGSLAKVFTLVNGAGHERGGNYPINPPIDLQAVEELSHENVLELAGSLSSAKQTLM
jgi:hypothetical protein